VSVRQILEPLLESDWVPSGDLLDHLRLREGGLKQSRVVETGFLKERRAEKSQSNVVEMWEQSIYWQLVQGQILEKRWSFDTHDLSTLEHAKERLGADTYRSKLKRATVDLSSVRGQQRECAWISLNPPSWPRFHLEPYLLADIRRNGRWDAGEDVWITNLLPNSEPLLLRRKAEGIAAHESWNLVLGTCDSTAVLTWPVEYKLTSADHLFFEVSSVAQHVQMKYVYNFEWELLPCVWASPSQQRALYSAPAELTKDAQLRLVSCSPAESIPKAGARFGWWDAGEKLLRRMAKHLSLPEELQKAKAFPYFLEALVRHYHPDLTDFEVLRILLLRAPEKSALGSIINQDDMQEHLDKNDRDLLQKEEQQKAKRLRRQIKFMTCLKPLQNRVRERQAAEFSARSGQNPLRERGPTAYSDASEEWSQDLVNSWVPPSSHMFRDPYNARWRVRWAFGNVSRSWAAHGYRGAALLCLQEAWTSHTANTGFPCPIPGIIEGQPAPSSANQSSEQGKGARKGRGRAGRGRGRGSAGRASEAGQAQPPAQGPASASSARLRSRSSSSSSSSSSGSGSSSSSS